MPTPLRRSLPITGVAVMMTGALAMAQTHATPAPRVRPETMEAAELLGDLVDRAATGRGLIEALNAGDVVVYIRHRTFTATTLDGRIGLVRSSEPTRMLIVEIACPRRWTEQLVTLGHELQHAVEIAAARGVVDPRSLAELFGRIGMRMGGTQDGATFETVRAQQVAAQIRKELLGTTARTTHDRH